MLERKVNYYLFSRYSIATALTRQPCCRTKLPKRLKPKMLRFLKGRSRWEWLFLAVSVAAVGAIFIGELRAEPFRFAFKILAAVVFAALALAIYESMED